MVATTTGLIIVVLVCGLFGAWMLVDCLIHQKEDKLVWVIVLLFLNFAGALLYCFIARPKRLSERKRFYRENRKVVADHFIK